MDVFIEWDNGYTDYHNQKALSLMWLEFLLWRSFGIITVRLADGELVRVM